MQSSPPNPSITLCCRSTRSPMCSSTASPNGCGRGRSGSRCWRMGLHERGPQGAVASYGGLKGGRRDGDGLLGGHEVAWLVDPLLVVSVCLPTGRAALPTACAISPPRCRRMSGRSLKRERRPPSRRPRGRSLAIWLPVSRLTTVPNTIARWRAFSTISGPASPTRGEARRIG